MSQNFFFIDGLHADKVSKRQMRGHVMKGKNAGKTLHRPSRLKQRNVKQTSGRCWPNERKVDEDQAVVSSIRGSGHLGHFSAVFWLPVEVEDKSLEVIHDFFTFTSDRIYSPKLGLSMDEAKALWLPNMLADEATYHCSIDMMQTCNQLILYGNNNLDALCCMSRTFTHVKKRLESDNALSSASIYMLMTLIMQEQIRQQSVAVRIHAGGLRKMVELRGGLSELENDIALVIKICKTDVVLALQDGDATTYFRDGIAGAEKTLATKGLYMHRDEVASPIRCLSIDHSLHQVFLDVMALCDLLNHHARPNSLDLITYQEILLSLFYRLLQFRSLNEARKIYDDQSTLHFGLVMFLMTVLLHHGTRRILDFRLATQCFQAVPENATGTQDETIKLWLLVIGGIWTSKCAFDDWLRIQIEASMKLLNISKWQETRAVLYKLPWIQVLHDQPGEAFWNDIHPFT